MPHPGKHILRTGEWDADVCFVMLNLTGQFYARRFIEDAVVSLYLIRLDDGQDVFKLNASALSGIWVISSCCSITLHHGDLRDWISICNLMNRNFQRRRRSAPKNG